MDATPFSGVLEKINENFHKISFLNLEEIKI
jgi:hypothetical protein